MHPRYTRILCLLSLLLLAESCGTDAEQSSVLFITLDTTRVDALTSGGGPAGVSPNLDALAAEGVWYRNARTTAPLTLPAHASMLTGLYPPRHTSGTTAFMLCPVPP